jgi:hypothetical protein
VQRPAAISALTLALGVSFSAIAAPVALEPSLRSANDAEVLAFLAADARGLRSLWAETFVVNNPLGKFVTGPQVVAMVSSGGLRFSTLTRSIDYAHQYGDITILAGTETCGWAGKFPLAGKTSTVRFTSIWQHSRDGKWLEVARHADILP